jgi:hypothetical protein
VEDCEDAFNEQVIANVTATLDNSVYKVGAGSAKFEVAAGFATGVIGSETISKDLSAYKSIYAWVRSTLALDASDWAILLDDHANCASPLKTLLLPGLAANTWKRVNLPLGDASGLSAIISLGLNQSVDKAALDFNIDDVRALKLLAGIKGWTLDWEYEVHNVKGFDDVGVPNKIPGGQNWKGTFVGFKDGAPLTIGSQVVLAFGESTAVTQQFVGEAVITNLGEEVDVGSAIGINYSFEGVGALEIPTA